MKRSSLAAVRALGLAVAMGVPMAQGGPLNPLDFAVARDVPHHSRHVHDQHQRHPHVDRAGRDEHHRRRLQRCRGVRLRLDQRRQRPGVRRHGVIAGGPAVARRDHGRRADQRQCRSLFPRAPLGPAATPSFSAAALVAAVREASPLSPPAPRSARQPSMVAAAAAASVAPAAQGELPIGLPHLSPRRCPPLAA